jgi:hypothetical protein
MVIGNIKNRKLHKIDTDKYEMAWHQLNGHETFVMSVWESPTYVGPEAYNAGHIDYILDNNPRNDVRTVINSDDGRCVCRRTLDKWRVKFTP